MKIAITGKIRSGKDTVADYLVDHYYFEKFGFGDHLKRIAMDLFPKEFEGTKPRKILQQVGQKMREIDPDIWVNKTFEDITFHDLISGNNRVLIKDLRQPNEYHKCKQEGFVIVRVNTHDMTRILRCSEMDNFEIQDLLHETELNIDKFEVDYDLFNDGSVDVLIEQVEALIHHIKSKN